jgi:prepilin-type N-terminal cleavage/methylation domain-containing protein
MKKAFSLIELLVSLSILAVVAAIIVPKFLGVGDQAKLAVASDARVQIENALQQFRALGGSSTNCSPGSIIQFLAKTAPRGTYIEGGNTLSDSAGVPSSSMISLPITVNTDMSTNSSSTALGCFSYAYSMAGFNTPPAAGFYSDRALGSGGSYAYYSNGKNVWSISIDSSGRVTFTGVRGAQNLP